jgi:hypothetical protein
MPFNTHKYAFTHSKRACARACVRLVCAFVQVYKFQTRAGGTGKKRRCERATVGTHTCDSDNADAVPETVPAPVTGVATGRIAAPPKREQR